VCTTLHPDPLSACLNDKLLLVYETRQIYASDYTVASMKSIRRISCADIATRDRKMHSRTQTYARSPPSASALTPICHTLASFNNILFMLVVPA